MEKKYFSHNMEMAPDKSPTNVKHPKLASNNWVEFSAFVHTCDQIFPSVMEIGLNFRLYFVLATFCTEHCGTEQLGILFN